MTQALRSEDARGQVRASAAEVYDEFFVPALFAEWAPRVLEAARVARGRQVLDVACGTGVLALAAAARGAAVTGLDMNPGMLAVARRHRSDVAWREGRAESLPFEDASFDAVLCQFGLMFFEDRVAALREMRRVLRPGGRLVLAVWATLAETPGYAAMVELLRRLFGEETAGALYAPYSLGDEQVLHGLLSQAGMPQASIETREGAARFPSVADWVRTDIKGWTLADRIDDSQYARLQEAAAGALAHLAGPDGVVVFDHPARLIAFGSTRADL
ncbi:MAG TPA: methyltransferase domain-containing protein [Burkholderiales bacterium]|nr:methyltransferase domain-containing protein [Burkholderiales bacterium]